MDEFIQRIVVAFIFVWICEQIMRKSLNMNDRLLWTIGVTLSSYIGHHLYN